MDLSKRERIYARVDPDLKEDLINYVRRKGTTITDLLTEYIMKVLEEDKKELAKQVVDAEQI